MAEELIGIGAAAALLGCNRSRVDQMIREGKLVAVTLPTTARRAGKWRYLHRSAVEKLRAEGYKPRPGRPGEKG